MREAAAGRRVLAGFTVAAAFALLGLAGSVLAVLGGITSVPLRGSRSLVCHRGPSGPIDNLRIITMMGVIVSSTLTPFVVWIGVSLIMQLVTRFFNGSGPLPAGLAVVGISIVPIALSAASGLVLTSVQATLGAQGATPATLGYVGELLGFAALAWFVVLVVIGASQARGFDYAESAGSCTVSCVDCAGLIILVVIVVGLGAVLLIGPHGLALRLEARTARYAELEREQRGHFFRQAVSAAREAQRRTR